MKKHRKSKGFGTHDPKHNFMLTENKNIIIIVLAK